MLIAKINDKLNTLIIDAGGEPYKNIFILNDNNSLIGVVSQGDMIKHILYGGNFNIAISDIANLNPVYVIKNNYKLQDLKKLFIKYGITEIPELDECRKILKVITIFEILNV